MSNNNTAFDLPKLPEGFRIMVAGNLGDAQDLDSIGECMLLLKGYKEIKWIFVGVGSRKRWLDSFIIKNNLIETAYTLGRFPSYAMPAFFKAADAMLVTLKGGYKDLELTVPARVQSYMSAGKPILGMIGKGKIDLIEEADCGFAVSPGDYMALADVIINKIIPNIDVFKQKGVNGRKTYENVFTLSKCIDNLEKIIS